MASFYINNVHSTRHMDYYDIYLTHTGMYDLNIESAYTNVKFDDRNRYTNGSPIASINTSGLNTADQWIKTKSIPPNFNGILRLEISPDSKLNNNLGFIINFVDNNDSSILIHLILLNNKLSKPKVLLPYGAIWSNCKPIKNLTATDNITSLSLDINSPSFVNKEALHNYNANFLLVQNTSDINKKECMLYTSKLSYTENEVINISFINVNQNLDTNISPIEILMYRQDDIPGISRSVDWAAIKFLDKDLGATNTITFPVDGERNIMKYPEGEYIIRLMYKYNDLCPPVRIKVSNKEKANNFQISPPPPGTFIIYKTNNNICQTSLSKLTNKYLTLSFTSSNQLMDLLVEVLFSGVADRNIIEYVYNIYTKKIMLIKDITVSKSFQDDYTQLLSSYLKSLLYSAFNNIVYNILNNFLKTSDNNASHDLVINIKNYITHNISEPITIEILANHFHFSKSHITHLFKRMTGISVNKYVTQVRILKAKEMLAKYDMSITQIAQALNYSDIHSFTHKYKQEAGQSPSQYRNEYRRVYSANNNNSK